MFDEMPSRRITERRKELLWAVFAAASLFGGYKDFEAHHRFDWSLILWAIVFLVSLGTYWKKRHPDPWSPPVEEDEQAPVNDLKIEGKN